MDAEFAFGFGGVFGHGAYFDGVAVFIVGAARLNVEHIVRENFLAHKNFFFSIDDEISAVVALVFAKIVNDVFREAG